MGTFWGSFSGSLSEGVTIDPIMPPPRGPRRPRAQEQKMAGGPRRPGSKRWPRSKKGKILFRTRSRAEEECEDGRCAPRHFGTIRSSTASDLSQISPESDPICPNQGAAARDWGRSAPNTGQSPLIGADWAGFGADWPQIHESPPKSIDFLKPIEQLAPIRGQPQNDWPQLAPICIHSMPSHFTRLARNWGQLAPIAFCLEKWNRG